MSENKGFDGAETEDTATTSTRPNLVISVQPHSQDSSRVELPVLTRDWQTNPRGQFIPVHGLDFLIGATSLLIQQTVELNDIASKIDSENRYIIRVPNGETLYIGSEASSPRQRCLCGSGRAFAMHLHDNTRQEALVLHRRLASASCLCPCRLQEMKVVMPPGEYVGRVQQQWTWLVPLYLVRGAADEVLYLIEGPARVRRSALQLAEFKVLFKGVTDTRDRVRTIKMAKTMHSIENHALKRGDSVSETILSGDSLREVGKISHGWDRELVSFTTLVQLPDTAALPKHKALVLAAAFLLEYTYFEKSKRSCGLCC